MPSAETFSCPVCGQSEMDEGDYSICGSCGWENDPFQMDFPESGGANEMSLMEARVYWQLTQERAPPNRSPEMQAAIKLVASHNNRLKYEKKYGYHAS